MFEELAVEARAAVAAGTDSTIVASVELLWRKIFSPEHQVRYPRGLVWNLNYHVMRGCIEMELNAETIVYLAQREDRRSRANLAVQKMALPNEFAIDPRKIRCLGQKFYERARRLHDNLDGMYGERLPNLVATSVKLIWFAAWNGAFFFEDSIADGTMRDSAGNRKCTKPEGYMESEGWAYMLYDLLSNTTESEHVRVFREGAEYTSKSIADTLLASALYFLSLAAEAFHCGKSTEVMEWIFEASEAQELQNGLYMWDAGVEHHGDMQAGESESSLALQATIERRRLSKNALDAKNKPNRTAQKYVRMEWEKNRSSYDGNKSEFARVYVPIVANNFKNAKGDPLKITEKQMREVWLSDAPPTRKPAR